MAFGSETERSASQGPEGTTGVRGWLALRAECLAAGSGRSPQGGPLCGERWLEPHRRSRAQWAPGEQP